MAASRDSSRFYERLGVSSEATQSEIKQAYLKLCLKWHPEKTRRTGRAKNKFAEITEAYEALLSPKVHRVQRGEVVCVSLEHQQFDTPDGVVSGFFTRFNIISWFRPSTVQEKVNSKVDNAFELLSEYMYDGDLGEFFTDADNTLHVIVSIPLARALVGGRVTFKVPTGDGSKINHSEEISGILDGYWRPIMRVHVDGRNIWVIFKVIFPKDMSEEEQIELRQKLLFAQTSAAILPTIWGWVRGHPKTSALGLLTLAAGGVAIFKRYSCFRILRFWTV